MRLSALKHLLEATQALCHPERIHFRLDAMTLVESDIVRVFARLRDISG